MAMERVTVITMETVSWNITCCRNYYYSVFQVQLVSVEQVTVETMACQGLTFLWGWGACLGLTAANSSNIIPLILALNEIYLNKLIC